MRFAVDIHGLMKLKHKIALTSLRIRLKLIAFVSPQKAAAEALVLFCRPRRKPPQSPSATIKKAKSIRLSVNGLCISGYRWNHPAPKKNIKANILWLHDKDDAITPLSDAEKVKADHHPNITFVISNGLGHSKIYRDKHTVNHILRFL